MQGERELEDSQSENIEVVVAEGINCDSVATLTFMVSLLHFLQNYCMQARMRALH